MARTNYKAPLKTREQVNYLEANKKVVFNEISKDDAEHLLYEHNYINVISPFKHRFARKTKKGEILRDSQNRHIYDNTVEFADYYFAYIEERQKYPIIFSKIMTFEATFNAIVSYEVIHFYHIDNYQSFLTFVSQLISNVNSTTISSKVKHHVLRDFNSFPQKMSEYDDIYLFLDRLNLSSIINVYQYCDKNLKNHIFKQLQHYNCTFGYNSVGTFNDFLVRIVKIRNCICHSNSLEILVNYVDIKNRKLRNSSDRKKYTNIIKKLS